MYTLKKISIFSFNIILPLVLLISSSKAYNQCFAKFKAIPNHSDTSCYFLNQSSGGMTHYFWDFGDGTYILEYDKINHTHKYPMPGKYTVVLTVWDLAAPNPCEATYSEEVVIGDSLFINPWAYFNYHIINDSTIAFEDTSLGEYNKTQWELGDGNILQNKGALKYRYHPPINPVVKLKVLNENTGKIDISEKFIVFDNDFPGIYFYVNHVDSTSKTVIFNDSTTGNFTEFFWDFGDGSTSYEQTPEHTYTSPGVYTVTFTGKAIGENNTRSLHSYSKEIIIKEPNNIYPKYYFFSDSDNKKAYLYNRTIPTTSATYLWSSGTGEIHNDEATTYFEYDEASNYTVSLRVDNPNQAAFLSKNIDFGDNNEIASDFYYFPDESNLVTFQNISSNPSTNFRWNFGDGSKIETTQSPTHQYQSPGLYTVYLQTNTDGYVTDFVKIINVNADQTDVYCDFMYFIDSTYQKAYGPIKYKGAVSRTISRSAFTLGDGYEDIVSMDLVKSYDSPGGYEVCYSVFDDFSGSNYIRCKTIMVPENIIEPFDPIFSDIIVYPNPAIDEIYIDFKKQNEYIVEISITDMNGKLVRKEMYSKKDDLLGRYKINNLNLLSSIYLVKIKTDKEIYTKKLQIIK